MQIGYIFQSHLWVLQVIFLFVLQDRGLGEGMTETMIKWCQNCFWWERKRRWRSHSALIKLWQAVVTQWSLFCTLFVLHPAGWGMEGLLWWTRSRNCGRVRHEIRHRVHIPSHDVSALGFVFLSSVCVCAHMKIVCVCAREECVHVCVCVYMKLFFLKIMAELTEIADPKSTNLRDGTILYLF